jgi:hypothetical protein
LWNPIPAGARVDVNSAAVRAKVAEAGASRVALLYEFGNKIYHADASTPRYKLNIVNAGVTKWGDNDLAYGTVPIPDGAVPGTGSDGKLVIVDHSTRKVYDLWQVFRSGSTWNVSWGGVYDLDGDGSSRNPAYGTGQWGVAWPKPLSRGTGSGMSTLAGTVKMSEIKAGVIPHALVFATDITCGPGQTGEFRWPATTTDGSRTSGTCIPEGARIQLDPSIDLTTIPGITKAELALGRALQTYGAYATDGGGSRISIGFEAPRPATTTPTPPPAWPGTTGAWTACPGTPSACSPAGTAPDPPPPHPSPPLLSTCRSGGCSGARPPAHRERPRSSEAARRSTRGRGRLASVHDATAGRAARGSRPHRTATSTTNARRAGGLLE